jgi:hypothetical protein
MLVSIICAVRATMLVTLFDLAGHGVRLQVESGCGAGRELPQQTSRPSPNGTLLQSLCGLPRCSVPSFSSVSR